MNMKVTLPAIAFACMLAGTSLPAMADDVTYSPTATDSIYDFSGFSDTGLVNLFTKAWEDGQRRYPTAAEFAAAGIQQSDIAFIRSHVRNIGILSRSNRLISDTYEKRDLWMNIPMDEGKDGDVGQPNTKFASDVYSMWNYTNIFGSWNHGLFSAPAAWTDAAHKNGTDIYSGIKFFDTTGGRDGSATGWIDYVTETDASGNFRYVEPIINCLMYFGFDGINYNWEDSGFSDDDIVDFHKQLYASAKKHGFDNFHCGIYTSYSGLSNSLANALFGDSEGRTHDLMLNYSSGDFSYQMSNSATVAENAMGTTEGLYAGVWIVSMNRGWTRLNADAQSKKVSLCFWGEHAQSRLWSYNTGADSYEQQANYQALQERLMSGGNRNPLNRPAISNTGNEWEETSDGEKPLSKYAGVATWIPERSAIHGNLPFATNFNLGNGDRYSYKGKKTAGSWYNMSNQDRVPTYRWLVVAPGTQTVSTDIQPEFSHADQYNGGTSLLLTGKATSTGTDIVLYKTELNVSAGGAYAKVAVKNGKEGTNASNLYVILQKKDGSWIETPYGNVEGNTWQEKKLDISALSQSDVITAIGLRVKGSDDAYKLYVGKLEINDNVKTTPSAVKDVNVEVKQETKTSMSAKIWWDVNATAQKRADWNLVYNDEANIDHFEVLYKNGEKGAVSEVARTTTWACYVGNIEFESTDDQPYIGVRAVSTDLKTYSPVEWVKIDRADQSTLPERVDDSYGISQMNPTCDGAATARQQRYVTSVTTTGADQNLAYTATGPVADGTQYVNATNQVLKVKQGQTVSMNIKCADFSDGLKWCFAGGWIDLNGDHVFNPDDIAENPTEGERLFFAGTIRAATAEFQTTGVNCTFTIPEDAVTGNSRLRIVFSDAWFAGAFLPTGLHNKGFSMDFGVEITGTNPEREAPVDIHDQGTAEQPEGLDGESTGIHETESAASRVSAEDGAFTFENVDKAWIYDASGALVQYAVAPTRMATTGFAQGIYLVKMQKGNVLRTQKLTVK